MATIWLYASVLVVALLLRLAGLSRPLWLDEASTLQWLRATSWSAWVKALLVDQSPPAFPLLLTPWSLVSVDPGWLRLLPMVCGVTTVAVAMWWVSSSRAAALRVGLLLAASPFLLRYSVELRPYALLGVATVVAGAAAWRISDAPEVRARDRVLMLGALLLACFTHFTAVMLLPAAVAAIVAGARDRPLRRVPWGGLASVSVAWAVLVFEQGRALAQLRRGWWMPPLDWTLAWRSAAEVAGLARPGGEVGVVVPAGLGVLALALLALFLAAERDRRWMAPMAAGATYLIGLALTSWLWRSVWWPRTLLPGYLALIVAVGVASTCLRGRRWRACADLAVAAATLAGAIQWVSGEAWEPLEPWPQVAVAIRQAQPTESVFVLPDYAAWPLSEALHDAPQPRLVSLRMDGRGNAGALAAIVEPAQGTGTIWLVLRLDLGVRDELPALASAFDLLRTSALTRASRVRVILVMSPDVSLVPALAETQNDVRDLLTARLGHPAQVQVEGRSTSLVFEPAALTRVR